MCRRIIQLHYVMGQYFNAIINILNCILIYSYTIYLGPKGTSGSEYRENCHFSGNVFNLSYSSRDLLLPVAL